MSVQRKIKLIYNPAARGGKSNKIMKKVTKYLDEKSVDYSLFETKGPLDAITQSRLARDEGYNLVAAIGGDGTAHEVANGVIESGLLFSPIPAGSGNDFVSALGIEENWEHAVETMLNGSEKSLSIIKAGDRYCINVLDVGFGADISKAAQTHLKWIKGSLKYTLLTLALLTRHKPYPVRMLIDGDEYEYNLNLVAAGFGQTFGSGMNILPYGRFNSDKMEVAVLHSASRFKFLRIFPKVFSGKHIEEKDHVELFKADEVVIEANENCNKILRAESEGELFAEGRIELKVMKKGLRVLVPDDWDLNNKSLKVKNQDD